MSKMTMENGNQIWRNEAWNWHREDGPAFIRRDGSEGWWINDIPITDKVEAWVIENDFPHWTKWTDTHKIMFRLAFSGISS